MLAEQIVNGLVVGGMYALIALGFTLVFGLLDKLNFTHGEIVMVAGFVALVSLQLGATVLQAAGVREGTRWQLCLVAPVPAAADRGPSSGSEPAPPPAAELHASAPASPLPSFRGRPR